MIRDVLDVTDVIVEVIEKGERSIKIANNGSLVLQIQIGSFQVGHAYKDYLVDTFVFNADGTMRKHIEWTEDDLSWDLTEWADLTLSGFGDYLKMDYAHKHDYYQIDLGDTGVRVFIGFVILWLICAPIPIIWVAIKYCSGRTASEYQKVDVDAEAET